MDIEEKIADSDYAADSIPVAERTAETNARLDALQTDVTELLTILRPMREVIESLPAAMEQVTPLIDGLRNSPVVKMLGIKIP